MPSADDVKMTEKPMPETLETIAAKIEALSQSNDERLARIDQQFAETRGDLGARIEALSKSLDRRFEESGAQLGVKIEAVEAKVVMVYDEVIAMREKSKGNATEHKTFTRRLDKHDVRILALENPGPPKP